MFSTVFLFRVFTVFGDENLAWSSERNFPGNEILLYLCIYFFVVRSRFKKNPGEYSRKDVIVGQPPSDLTDIITNIIYNENEPLPCGSRSQ